MAEDNLKINVEAESKALTPLVESENFISHTEKVKNSFLEIETPETLMMSAKSEPVVPETLMMSAKFEPVVPETLMMSAKSEPVVPETLMMSAKSEPLVAETLMMSAKSEPVEAETLMMSAKFEPVVPETLMMSAKSEPVVEAEPKISPKIENISSIVEQDKNKILAIKTQNLEQLVDKNLIPAISKMYKDITNRINNDKDPKEALERRPTFGLHNLVFDDRLNRLTDAPFWV